MARRVAGRSVCGRPRRGRARRRGSRLQRSPRCLWTTCCSPARPRSAARCSPRRAEPDAGDAGTGRQVAGDRRTGFPARPRRAHRLRQMVQRRADLHRRRITYWSTNARAIGFVEAIVAQCVRATATRASDDYTRIINDAEYARLGILLDDARTQGARRSADRGRPRARATRAPLFPPTLVLDPPRRMRADARGDLRPDPPGRGLRSVDAAIAYVNSHDRVRWRCILQPRRGTRRRCCAKPSPAASRSTTRCCSSACTNCRSAASARAACGALHGRAGFETFSKQLPVFRQTRWAITDRLRPPYVGVVDRAIRLLAR